MREASSRSMMPAIIIYLRVLFIYLLCIIYYVIYYLLYYLAAACVRHPAAA